MTLLQSFGIACTKIIQFRRVVFKVPEIKRELSINHQKMKKLGIFKGLLTQNEEQYPKYELLALAARSL